MKKKKLLTAEQAGEEIGMSGRTIRRYVAEGQLRGWKVGKRSIRIDAADLDSILERVR